MFHSGEFYSLLSAVLWAVGVVLYRRSGEHLSPVALNLFKTGVGLFMFVVTMLLLGVPFVPPERTIEDWTLVIMSGAVGIGVADTLLFAGINRIGAGRFGVVGCVYSPFVVLSSLFLLHEPMPATLFIAMTLLGVAIVLGVWEPARASTREQKRRNCEGIALGMAAMFLTAVTIVIIKPVLDRSSVWWVSMIRIGAGFVVIVVHAVFSRHRQEIAGILKRPSTWRVALPAALFGTYLAFFFWNLGMKHTYTTTASVLNETSNVFILLLSWLFLRERLGPRQWLAIVLGFAGAVVVLL